MTDDQLIADISQIVLGFREGSNAEILEAIREVKSDSEKYEANKRIGEFFDKVGELAELKEEILDT